MRLVFTFPMIQIRRNIIWAISRNMKNLTGLDIVILKMGVILKAQENWQKRQSLMGDLSVNGGTA